jgi:hypothetical protein
LVERRTLVGWSTESGAVGRSDGCPADFYIDRVPGMSRRYLALAGLLVPAGVLLFASWIPDSALRWRAYVMVLVLTAVFVLAQLPVFLGPAGGRGGRLVRIAALAVVAVDVVGGIEAMRAEAHVNGVDPEVPVAWTVLLSVQLLAVVAVTSRRLSAMWSAAATGLAFGSAAFVLWALLCLMQPDIPSSNAPTVLCLALAVIAAALWRRERGEVARHGAVAGLSAAATVGLLSGVLIDVVLPHLGRWVSSSSPPSHAFGPIAPHRLVDPVGILMLSAIMAVALLSTVLIAGRPARVGRPVPAT